MQVGNAQCACGCASGCTYERASGRERERARQSESKHASGRTCSHMFTFTCSFLRSTFGPKSTLFVSMFTNKVDFGPKVDLKNERVKMNMWMNLWAHGPKDPYTLCALTCEWSTCAPVRSLAYPLAHTCAHTFVSHVCRFGQPCSFSVYEFLESAKLSDMT